MQHLAESFVSAMQVTIPDLKVVPKEQSRLMRFLGKVLFFVPNFVGRYTTTLGSTIYASKQLQEDTLPIPTLAHECQHILDNKRLWILYPVIYLFPQILAVLSLLSTLAIWFSMWHLLWLLCLLFLAPIPAPGRVWVEKRGYLMSLVCYCWLYDTTLASNQLSFMLQQFTGPAYYFMRPYGETKLRLWLLDNMKRISETPSLGSDLYVKVFSFIEARRSQ